MKFQETPLSGAFVVELEPHRDDRGFFSRTYCAKEFEAHGMVPHVVQSNVSFTKEKGALRGLHYQIPPHEETKFVRCIRGALFDVIVDIRPDSSTFGQWFGVELTADNRTALFVPRGFAHAFQTLAENTEAFYQVSEFYTPGSERGIRYNDPKFSIDWPLPITSISDKDANWPDYSA